MSDLLVWIDENLFLSYAIFVLLIIPLIQKIDSTSKIYSIGLLLPGSFLLALRVIWNELDMSICFPSTVPKRAPITRSVLLVSGSFL